METISAILTSYGLKVTPQRIAILEAVTTMNNHPTADKISEYVRQSHPNIAIGTIYKILETLVEKKIIRKVKTESDIMRYDAVKERHHHIYCTECDEIQDYFDEELDQLLENYFKTRRIPNFKIEDVKLQIIGKFLHLAK
jgi:Fur family peroxide stress response transcriptional regulator